MKTPSPLPPLPSPAVGPAHSWLPLPSSLPLSGRWAPHVGVVPYLRLSLSGTPPIAHRRAPLVPRPAHTTTAPTPFPCATTTAPALSRSDPTTAVAALPPPSRADRATTAAAAMHAGAERERERARRRRSPQCSTMALCEEDGGVRIDGVKGGDVGNLGSLPASFQMNWVLET